MYYYLNNYLGTPVMMTDDQGVIVWEADYKPFGEALINPNSEVVNNFRFPGQYYDEETGLHYNYFRYYDPKTGRYLRPDPTGIEDGYHLYVYARNNPIALIDPAGLWCYTVLDIPLYILKTENEVQRNDWGKWRYFDTYTEGGQYPVFWLNATCICARERFGIKRTIRKMSWFQWIHCIEGCEDRFDTRLHWETISDTGQKATHENDFELIAGGSFMNKSSAIIACEKKCQNLNQ
jgi:RHS repeat-associated protein